MFHKHNYEHLQCLFFVHYRFTLASCNGNVCIMLSPITCSEPLHRLSSFSLNFEERNLEGEFQFLLNLKKFSSRN